MLFHAGYMKCIVSQKAPFLHDGKRSFKRSGRNPVYLHGTDAPDIFHYLPDGSCFADKFRVQFYLMNNRLGGDTAAAYYRGDDEAMKHFV